MNNSVHDEKTFGRRAGKAAVAALIALAMVPYCVPALAFAAVDGAAGEHGDAVAAPAPGDAASSVAAPAEDGQQAPAAADVQAPAERPAALVAKDGAVYTQADVEGIAGIEVPKGCNITFKDVSFTALEGPAIRVSGKGVRITVDGTCAFAGAKGSVGVEVARGAVCTIVPANENAKLTVSGTAADATGDGAADEASAGPDASAGAAKVPAFGGADGKRGAVVVDLSAYPTLRLCVKDDGAVVVGAPVASDAASETADGVPATERDGRWLDGESHVVAYASAKAAEAAVAAPKKAKAAQSVLQAPSAAPQTAPTSDAGTTIVDDDTPLASGDGETVTIDDGQGEGTTEIDVSDSPTGDVTVDDEGAGDEESDDEEVDEEDSGDPDSVQVSVSNDADEDEEDEDVDDEEDNDEDAVETGDVALVGLGCAAGVAIVAGVGALTAARKEE